MRSALGAGGAAEKMVSADQAQGVRRGAIVGGGLLLPLAFALRRDIGIYDNDDSAFRRAMIDLIARRGGRAADDEVQAARQRLPLPGKIDPTRQRRRGIARALETFSWQAAEARLLALRFDVDVVACRTTCRSILSMRWAPRVEAI